jgi:hypothetical protein
VYPAGDFDHIAGSTDAVIAAVGVGLEITLPLPRIHGR